MNAYVGSTFKVNFGIFKKPYGAKIVFRNNVEANVWQFSAITISAGATPAYNMYIAKSGSSDVGTPLTSTSSYPQSPWVAMWVGSLQTVGEFVGFTQDFRIFNRVLSTDELNSLCKRGPISMSSLYSRWSDPTALVSFSGAHTDMVNKGYLTPTSVVVGGATATNLVYASTSLKLMQGSMAANLQTNSLDAAVAPLTYVKYSIASPYLGAPSTLMFWAKLPSAAVTNSSSSRASTILTLSHGLNTDADVRLRVYVTSLAGTSHEVNAEWYPLGTGVCKAQGLAFGAWVCFGLLLLQTSPWSAEMYYSTNFTNFTYSGTSTIAPSATTEFTEVLFGREYFQNAGGFPGQIANFRIFSGSTSSFNLNPNGFLASDFVTQALVGLA